MSNVLQKKKEQNRAIKLLLTKEVSQKVENQTKRTQSEMGTQRQSKQKLHNLLL